MINSVERKVDGLIGRAKKFVVEKAVMGLELTYEWFATQESEERFKRARDSRTDNNKRPLR